MENMEIYFANEVITAFDNPALVTMDQRTAAGQARYNAFFGTVTKRRIYGKYIEKTNILLETSTSPETGTDYSTCIVAYA